MEECSGQWCQQRAQSLRCFKHGLTLVSQELGGNIELVPGSGHGGAAGAMQMGFVIHGTLLLCRESSS